MEIFYYMVFGALAAVVAALELSKSNKDRINTSTAFNSFKNNYLLVYSLMMAGDWLQGPYVYYLYSTYGFGKGEIGQLFIAGFGSSMLFGTIVGSLADKQGRKRACVTYCITYILSCITKHSPQYRVLMIGRVLGGIATSLLFSAFESWLVAEHFKRGFDQQWLSLTFSKAIFLGNGLVAILSGLFGNFLVDSLNLGPVSPFDAAAILLSIGMAVILSSWTENYGDPSENKDLLTQFKGAAVAIASDEKIALLGAIQSLFEGSMYTFVFLWTPALSPNDEDIPHGFIFATFMLASMLGSSIAARLLARNTIKVESYMQIVFVISSVSLLLPILTNFLVPTSPKVKGGGISFSGSLQLLGFCTFEACVGLFWPSIMKMRSQYIPEEARSTIMNFFRIPLNIFVCVVLYNVNAFPITIMFGMCSIFLFVASILQRRLSAIGDKPKSDDRRKSSSSSIYRALRIQNAATKKAKTPAEEDWKIKRQVLLEKRVRSVDVKEAFRLQNENNFVILDVRPEAEFKEAHPEGAINVQIYRLIKEWTAWDIARRAAFAFFGIFSGTEENPEFIQSVESKIAKNAKIIVACSAGGTTKPSQNLPEGQQSRSLIAAYLLVLNGYSNVYHLEGGIYNWFKESLPSVSEE
ncbi:Major facilitator superfamily protein [Striga hermonthica]|uniref:Molybdate-anion transporter n=1 Tax=Striga hermonthica TaxID=68872 RepID=A0A9N7MQS8_STRHE|nr:Major facilitator superfamily protein [Striga hermonthica]